MNKLFFVMPIFCLTMLNMGSNSDIIVDQNLNLKELTIAKKSISPEDKIVFENCNNVFMSTDSEVINASVEKKYSLTVKLDYDDIQPNYFETEEEKKLEIERLKAFHTTQNELAIQNIDFSNFDDVYVSKYAPYVSIDTSYESIANTNFNFVSELAENDNVEMIYVNEWNQEVPTLEYTQYCLGAQEYITNGTYDGTGITVGILELGIPDKNSENLINKDIKIRNVWNATETVKEHSTIMASIIGGKNGFAPKCALRCAQLFGDPVAEIDWMMDNGAYVINCSYGDADPTGKYNSESAYFDYIARLYKVLFVCAAGNFGDTSGYVGNPGLGYNVLTVGACSIEDGRVRGFSSSLELDGPRKPDVVAPGFGVNIQPYGSQDGTSVSAAVTTGVVALLMQSSDVVKANPTVCISSLSATALDKTSGHSGNGFHERAGTGEIDFANHLAKNEGYYIAEFTRDKTTQVPYSIYLYEGDVFRYSAWWPAYATGKVNETTMSNYNLYIYDFYSNIIYSEETNVDNKEFLEFTAPEEGYYKFGIKRTGDMPAAISEEYASLCYAIN